ATSSLNTLFYSSDNGSTWHQTNLPLENATFVSSVASDGSAIAYAGAFGQSSSVTGLYKSTDAGVTFLDRTNSLRADIERLAAKGSNVLASTVESAAYSTNFGDIWFTSSPIGGFIATYTLRSTQIFAGNGEGAFLSSDNGASW